MNTIRNIRIATGIKRIELSNENMAVLQIGDVLKQHRDTLITSLLSDLVTYIRYQFQTQPGREQLEKIRQKLVGLRHATLSVARYSALISQVLENETTYVPSEPFYQEINEMISEELSPTQLVLMK